MMQRGRESHQFFVSRDVRPSLANRWWLHVQEGRAITFLVQPKGMEMLGWQWECFGRVSLWRSGNVS